MFHFKKFFKIYIFTLLSNLLSNSFILKSKLNYNLKSKTFHNAILVVGGAGKTGREIIYQSLKNNMEVVSLVRSTNKDIIVPEGSGKQDNIGLIKLNDFYKLNIVEGSVTNDTDVNYCFDKFDIDGVIISLGGNTNKVGKNMLEVGTKHVIESMKKNNCKKISVITSVGTGDSYDQAPLFFKGLMATIYKDMFVDKNNQEKLFDTHQIGHDLEWCVIRPGGLTLGPLTENNIIPTNDIIGSISRADVAKFCIDSMNDSFPYSKQKVSISNLNAVRDHN